MTPEQKRLLVKDLCARLPYWPRIKIEYDDIAYIVGLDDTEKGLFNIHVIEDGDDYDTIMSVEDFKPYLCPISSMTKEERLVYEQRLHDVGRSVDVIDADDVEAHIDWLLSNHFDFRGLIPKGLALVALEGMYKTE